MRPSVWLLAVAILAGCRAPMPSFKPYSNTRVPPPQTGEVGAGDLYYNNGVPAQPPTTTPASQQSKSGKSTSLSSNTVEEESSDELAWTTPRRSRSRDDEKADDSRYGATIRRSGDPNTRQAAFEDDSNSNSAVQTLEYESSEDTYQPGSTRARNRIRFDGMPVNDATDPGTWKAR